jgi:hypothetical protein
MNPKRLPTLLPWLALAALADWLVTRTLTRLAIFIPKTPGMIEGYQALSLAGQVAGSLAGVLALAGLGWIAWAEWQGRRSLGIPLVLGARAGLGLLFLVLPPPGWLAAFSHLLTLLAIALLVYPGLSRRDRRNAAFPLPLANLMPALALSLGTVFHLAPTIYVVLGWPGPPSFAIVLFFLGELAAALTPVALWWRWGRGASRAVWAGAALPALAFAGTYLAAPAMTGTLAIWSIGMTLYLPWPFYAVGLWLAGVTVFVGLRRQPEIGWGILLLAAGGYAPQFSVQIFFSLIALWLLNTASCGVGEASHVTADSAQSAPWPSALAGSAGTVFNHSYEPGEASTPGWARTNVRPR